VIGSGTEATTVLFGRIFFKKNIPSKNDLNGLVKTGKDGLGQTSRLTREQLIGSVKNVGLLKKKKRTLAHLVQILIKFNQSEDAPN
jgi:hypothetical protein